MRIRGKFNPCYGHSEKLFVSICLSWISKPLIYRVLKKWKRNFLIALCRKIIKFFSFRGVVVDRYGMNLYDYSFVRTLPISLTKEDLINSLKSLYKENVGDVKTSYAFAKEIPEKEHESLKQESQKQLKMQYQYLNELIKDLL